MVGLESGGMKNGGKSDLECMGVRCGVSIVVCQLWCVNCGVSIVVCQLWCVNNGVSIVVWRADACAHIAAGRYLAYYIAKCCHIN